MTSRPPRAAFASVATSAAVTGVALVAIGFGAVGAFGVGGAAALPSGSATATTAPTTAPSTTALPSTSTSASPSASATATAAPTVTASATSKAALTLVTDAVFVKLGQLTRLSDSFTVGAAPVAGQVVTLTETFVDGKVVPLGTALTKTDGTYALTIRPLYIGTIVATAAGITSNAVPSRVTVTYRSMHAGLDSRGHLSVQAQTRPGFVASSSRQERAQVLLVNSSGKQVAVLSTVDAAQRRFYPGEAQGTNSISYTTSYKLRPGTYRVVVRVIGTPVNTGAPSDVSVVKVP